MNEEARSHALHVDVFISYSSKDIDKARLLRRLLEDHRVPCWMAPEDVPPGEDYGKAILEAIKTAPAFVLLLSQHASASPHVCNEVERASSNRRRIIPVRLDDSSPGPSLELHLARCQWIDGWNCSLESVADTLAMKLRTTHRPPAPAIKRSAFRSRFPWVVPPVAVLAVVLLWTWPAPEMARMWRVIGTMIGLFLAFLLLLIWALFLSPFSRAVRIRILLGVVLAGGAFGATFRFHSFNGDMVPIFVWRWSRPHDDLLEENRREQSVGAMAPLELTDRPTDFPAYRGRRRDGVVIGPPLARDWSASPPRLLWKQPIGGGYAAFAVAGNLAVTIEQRRDQEVVAGYDTATGRERWAYAYPAQFSEKLGGDGPRATPTIADGYVYALGATGALHCLDAHTGQPRWHVDILEDNDNLRWGMSGAPLVYDQFVVVSPGKQRPSGHTLVALDRATGKKLWTAGEARAGYSSPLLATLAGKRQILLFDGKGLAGYDAVTGKELWRFGWETEQDINVAQPVVLDGDRVFISSGYDVGCAMLQITLVDGKWTARVLWRKRTMRCKFTSPVARQGCLYGLDDGFLACLDEKTGERRWREGRYGHGQLLLADDLLLILGESGELALVEANPAAYRELGRLQVFDSKTWNNPALADGKAYLRNDQEMACYDLTTTAR